MISTLSQSSKIYIKALKERKKKAITINCGELRPNAKLKFFYITVFSPCCGRL